MLCRSGIFRQHWRENQWQGNRAVDRLDGHISPGFGMRRFRLAMVDRPSGNIFVSRRHTGVWMSGDQEKTFSRAEGGKVPVGEHLLFAVRGAEGRQAHRLQYEFDQQAPLFRQREKVQ